MKRSSNQKRIPFIVTGPQYYQGLEEGVWITNHELNFRTFTSHVTFSRITWLGDELIKSICHRFLLVSGLLQTIVGLNDLLMGRKQKVCWSNCRFSVFCFTTTKLTGNDIYCYKIEALQFFNFEPSSRHLHLNLSVEISTHRLQY